MFRKLYMNKKRFSNFILFFFFVKSLLFSQFAQTILGGIKSMKFFASQQLNKPCQSRTINYMKTIC
jgi:hypothetical protein